MGRMIRTFVGLALSDEVRRRLAKTLGWWRSHVSTGVRWVRPENLHVTLNFLGDTRPEMLSEVSRLVMEAAATVAPFEASIEGMGCFPPKKRPRVLWAGVRQGVEPLTELHDRIDAAVVAMGFRAERRRYVPHVTLGRISTSAAEKVEQLLEQTEEAAYGVFPADAVTYYRSDLKQGGPVYTALATAPLGGALS